MFVVYIYLIKRHGIGFRDRAKEKNIESETVVTDLICTVVLFSAVLGQHCGLHVCTTFSIVLTLIHDFFSYSYEQREEGERKSKKERKDTENITYTVCS